MTQAAPQLAFEVLLVEDNDNDAELMKIAFAKTRFELRLHVVPNGEHCMAYLSRQGPYANAPMPDVVLLDLNTPGMNGLEVLRAIREDARLQHLPIIMVTSSEADADVLAAWRLRCSSYVIKPLDFDSFASAIRLLAEYWFTLVKLPTHTPGSARLSRY